MLSQTTEYALRAAVTLAKEPGRARTAQDLADATCVPPGYMSKVLLGLVRAGLVQSQRGLGGGFSLSRDPADITILDVVNVFDPLRPVEVCPLGLPEHAELCPLHRRLRDAVHTLMDVFGGTTLADLMREEQGGICDPLAPVRRAAARAAGEQPDCACRPRQEDETPVSPLAHLRLPAARLKNPA